MFPSQHHNHDSLLFSPTFKDYVDYVDPSYSFTTSEVLDCDWMESVPWELEAGECLDEHPVEVVCGPIMLMEEDEALSHLFP